jgi:gamma-glutamyl hydrolase
VPIRYYSSDDELRRLFNSVNGLIFPGGLTDLWLDSPYVVAARKLWTWAREANDAGDVFPIHGTCLGFQLLHILEANVSFTRLLVDTDSVAHATTLQFTPAAAGSAMYGGMDADLVAALGDPSMNASLENHMFGLPPAHYDRWPVLRDTFSLVTTAVDRAGVTYVSSAEHKRYPFTATQWHPEKPPFEFGMAEVPHCLAAIRVSQHLANVFVDTARRSSHKFESNEEEINELIYNYKSWFTLKDSVMDPSYDGPDHTYFLDRGDDEPHEGPDDGPDAARAAGALGAAFGARRARGAEDAGLAAGMAAARAEGRLRGKGAEQPQLGLRAAADA